MAPTLSQYLRQFLFEERLQRFKDVVAQRTRHINVVLENIFHAHNASACLRTCDCFGVQDVHIIEDMNQFKPNEEVALGANQWLSISRYQKTEDCLNQLRESGYRILATSPRQHSKPLHEVEIDQKTAIVFGAEQVGVSDEAISMADELIHIPMYGFTESFNISVSAGLCLQQFTTRLRQDNFSWQLPQSEQEELLESWVRRSLGTKLEPLIRRFEQDYPEIQE